jgi:hypothetical protein
MTATIERERSTDPVRVARSRVGVASRKYVKVRDPERLRKAKLDLNAAVLERHILDVLAAEPSITQKDRKRLASLLRNGEPGA